MSRAEAAAWERIRDRVLEERRRYRERVKAELEAIAAAKKAKQLASDAARLAMADQARDREDFYLASMIYLRLATARRESESITIAKERLIDLQAEGKRRLAKVDATLEENHSLSATERNLSAKAEVVQTAFSDYDALAHHFSKVPNVGTEIRSQVVRQRNKPENARVLNEPKALELLVKARELEAADSVCCAVPLYEKAAKIPLAPSAKKAKDRLEELKKNPTVVAAAKRCQEILACESLCRRAKSLIKGNPQKAKKMYREVILRAPQDSDVYRDAQKMIHQLVDA